ncbi:MAG: hypothetical protein ACI8RD_014064, partial [Bacillariaceae sp.]
PHFNTDAARRFCKRRLAVIVFCFVFNLLNWYNNKKKEIGMR